MPLGTANWDQPETVTRLISLATGHLSTPPLMGVGTAANIANLALGLAVGILTTPRGPAVRRQQSTS